MSTDLTDRQQAVKAMVAQGLTIRQIAKALDISTQGVHDHIARIERRLGIELKPKSDEGAA